MRAFILLACFTLIKCSSMSDTDSSQIRAQRLLSNAAIAAHDAATVASFWTEDYHLITSRNAEAHGRQSNMERFKAEMDAKPDVRYVRKTSSVEVFPDWKMAAEQGTWEGTWSEGADKIKLTGSYFAKWHKVNGKWLIRGEIFVPLHCEGDKFCKEGPLGL